MRGIEPTRLQIVRRLSVSLFCVPIFVLYPAEPAGRRSVLLRALHSRSFTRIAGYPSIEGSLSGLRVRDSDRP